MRVPHYKTQIHMVQRSPAMLSGTERPPSAPTGLVSAAGAIADGNEAEPGTALIG